MDDAVVLPCGHSFGSGGIQQVIGMVRYSEKKKKSLVNHF